MRAYVDQDTCIGCGLCATIAPEVFEMGDDDKSHVIADTSEENRASVEEAIDSCPVGAIREEE